jgi:hypothetical protein
VWEVGIHHNVTVELSTLPDMSRCDSVDTQTQVSAVGFPDTDPGARN